MCPPCPPCIQVDLSFALLTLPVLFLTRALNIFPLAALANLCRPKAKKLTLSMQVRPTHMHVHTHMRMRMCMLCMYVHDDLLCMQHVHALVHEHERGRAAWAYRRS